MDCSDIEREQNGSLADSMELISDSPHSMDKEDCRDDDCEDGPLESDERWTPTKRPSKRQGRSSNPNLNWSSDDSLSILPLKIRIEDFIKHPYRLRKRCPALNLRSKRRRIAKIKKNLKEVRKKRSQVAKKSPADLTEMQARRHIFWADKRRRLQDRGIQFPGTPYKYLPIKLYFQYEQFVIGGFLNHVRKLKYARSVREFLRDSKIHESVAESMEYDESMQVTKYSYIDEDGPLSPISESGECDNEAEDDEEEEIKIVSTSTFVLDCQMPSKKQWHILEKGKKRSADNQT